MTMLVIMAIRSLIMTTETWCRIRIRIRFVFLWKARVGAIVRLGVFMLLGSGPVWIDTSATGHLFLKTLFSSSTPYYLPLLYTHVSAN